MQRSILDGVNLSRLPCSRSCGASISKAMVSDEALIAAVRHRGSETSTQAGDYSILLLRKLIDGVVVTFPVIVDFFSETCIAECALERHEIINVLDLNGDGKLEILTRSSGYESITQTIFSIEDFMVKKRLEWTCGT